MFDAARKLVEASISAAVSGVERRRAICRRIIIVSLHSNDEPKDSLIQTPGLVQLLLTAQHSINPFIA